MTTAIDTNVIVALWDQDAVVSSAAQSALDTALQRGGLIVSAPVFAELMACPGRNEEFLRSFVEHTGIAVDWDLDETIWRLAGRAFQNYAARRRKKGSSAPRRILADFVIGAHAAKAGHQLLTFDDRFYRAAFPRLMVVSL